MTVPNLPRWNVVQNVVAALEAVCAGDDYRLDFRKVGTVPKPVDLVPVRDTPFLTVVGSDGTEQPTMSKRMVSTVTVTVQGYIRPDVKRWADTDTVELSEWFLADIVKALDTDLGRGCNAAPVPEGFRSIDVFHSLDGDFSVLVIEDTYEMKRTIS